jgi:hypothetical protein
MTPPRGQSSAHSDKSLKPLPNLARNWKFESTPLQRRVSCSPRLLRVF